jgi:hypothetical protein
VIGLRGWQRTRPRPRARHLQQLIS